ncbi:MAG: hypothetical protein HY648_11540 [Acidobacteria bacterium]|nr:hypothetical protein [Acidobacteriota bacterium]
MKIRKILGVVPLFSLLAVSCNSQPPKTPGDGAPTTVVPQALGTESSGAAASEEASPELARQIPPGTHRDHDPKHGGTFFMALDDVHHLEGVLEPPGTFRVYLYDSRSYPLALERLKQASGWISWGEAEDSPQTPLKLSPDKQSLKAAYGQALKLPVVVTLWLALPGAPPNSKPEVFTFIFSGYSKNGPKS